MTDRLSALLELQDHDTAIDQLRHRRATLEERVELAGVHQRLAELGARVVEAAAERAELTGRQTEIEQHVEAAGNRRGQIERQMLGGAITAPRDLQAMDDEVRQLGRHMSELEDREIEIMEAIEPLDALLRAADVQRETLEGTAEQLRTKIAGTEQHIEDQLSEHGLKRKATAQELPPDLLERYLMLRQKLGGTGAARLVGSSCGGCHLVLPSMEIDRIRKAPPDVVVTCEQCGRILVR